MLRASSASLDYCGGWILPLGQRLQGWIPVRLDTATSLCSSMRLAFPQCFTTHLIGDEQYLMIGTNPPIIRSTPITFAVLLPSTYKPDSFFRIDTQRLYVRAPSKNLSPPLPLAPTPVCWLEPTPLIFPAPP